MMRVSALTCQEESKRRSADFASRKAKSQKLFQKGMLLVKNHHKAAFVSGGSKAIEALKVVGQEPAYKICTHARTLCE